MHVPVIEQLASGGELFPEHRQAALRLRLGGLILDNVPVLCEHSISNANDIGSNPGRRKSDSREPSVNDNVVVVCNDYARLIFERGRQTSDKIEKTVPAGVDVCAVLDI